MSNDHKNKTTAKISKKRSFSCISFCFTGPPVLGDDPPTRPAVAIGSKRKLSPWFSWARSQKKMKSTAPVGAPAATFLANNPRRRPAENSGPASTLELEQSNLPLVATSKDSQRLSAGSSFNSAKFQSGPTTSKPATPRRIGGGGGGAAAADSAMLVRDGTHAPVVGLWLMVAMLAIVVLAGPATAVVCFCSCLYLYPRSSPAAFVAAANSGRFRADLNSAEHKKKVILEGLLERNGRRKSLAASTDRMR